MSHAPAAAVPPPLRGRPARAYFLLEDGMTFLNHGSYGATPRTVLAAQDEWRRRLEAQPVRFMQRELPGALRAAADKLAAFLGAAAEDLVFVENATAGVNAVLRSLDLGPDDEVLITDHVYPAVRNALAYVCRRHGTRIVEVKLPFPAGGAAEIEAAVAGGLSARTRLALFDYVASASALVLPVERLAALARDAGAEVLIDAAHAPGMIGFDVTRLGADWVVGNAHKWLFAPKGTAFLWASRPAQGRLHPTVISHGFEQGFLAEFDWVGTRDPSGWLAIDAALDFHRAMGGAALRRHNRDLAAAAAQTLATAWDSVVGGPPAMLGSMATVRLPARWQPGAERLPQAGAALHDRLWRDHRIEVPVVALADALWVRVSAQIYNEIDDYRRLARVLT